MTLVSSPFPPSKKSSLIIAIILWSLCSESKSKSDRMKNKKHIEPDWERGYSGRGVKGRDVRHKGKGIQVRRKRKKYTEKL